MLLTFFFLLLCARRRQNVAQRPVAGARLRPSPIYTKRMFSFFFSPSPSSPASQKCRTSRKCPRRRWGPGKKKEVSVGGGGGLCVPKSLGNVSGHVPCQWLGLIGLASFTSGPDCILGLSSRIALGQNAAPGVVPNSDKFQLVPHHS